MSLATLRIVFAVILIAHGIGHYMGVLSSFNVKMSPSQSSTSKLLDPLLGESFSRVLCFVLHLLPLVGFLAAGWALLGWLVPQDWWIPLAVISAVLSMLALVFYWNGLAFAFNKVGAVLVNLAVLICLLLLKWPPGLINRAS